MIRPRSYGHFFTIFPFIFAIASIADVDDFYQCLPSPSYHVFLLNDKFRKYCIASIVLEQLNFLGIPKYLRTFVFLWNHLTQPSYCTHYNQIDMQYWNRYMGLVYVKSYWKNSTGDYLRRVLVNRVTIESAEMYNSKVPSC